MSVVIGLDIGGSTTKVVGFTDGQLLREAFVKANDPVASAYGGVGKFLSSNQLSLSDIERIMVTGVGSSYVPGRILERPTEKVGEFEAVGYGGLYTSQCQRAIVISMGTGTSIVRCDEMGIKHVIGSGVGGGTLLGLANKLLNVRDFDLLEQMADGGNLSRVDLTIADISTSQIPGLAMDTTASNFGKASDDAGADDLALGIVNLVFQSVGTAAVLASRLEMIPDLVFVGSMQRLRAGQEVLKRFADLYKVNIHIPPQAEYSTAIGAALLAQQN